MSSSLRVSNNVHMINLQSNVRLIAYIFIIFHTLFDNMKEKEMGGQRAISKSVDGEVEGSRLD